MKTRWIVLAAALVAARLPISAQSVSSPWYPTQPGTRWVYQHESRDGGNRGGIAHPAIERWKTAETIRSTRTIPEGTLVLIRVDLFDHLPSTAKDRTKQIPREYSLLLRNDCLYDLQGADRQALLRNEVQPELCFPMTVGGSWGRVSETDPAEDGVWNVKAVNGDPFGLKGGKTFHLSAHEGSGTLADVWFAPGTGVLQEVVEHHGTYWEERRQLLSITINGTLQTYDLRPARTVPRGQDECVNGWKHFGRANGTAFSGAASCAAYVARTVE